MSPIMRKPAFCIGENKGADQLHGDKRLCFRYIDSTIPLHPKSEISSLKPSSMTVEPGLCQTWSETQKTDFLMMQLMFYRYNVTCPCNFDLLESLFYMSRIMRKPAFCICENKGADQLCGNRTADQHLCFRYIDSTTPLLPKYEISSF